MRLVRTKDATWQKLGLLMQCGKSVDDVVIVVTPGGEKEYEVSNVEHK